MPSLSKLISSSALISNLICASLTFLNLYFELSVKYISALVFPKSVSLNITRGLSSIASSINSVFFVLTTIPSPIILTTKSLG